MMDLNSKEFIGSLIFAASVFISSQVFSVVRKFNISVIERNKPLKISPNEYTLKCPKRARFNRDGNSWEDAVEYFRNLTTHNLLNDWILIGICEIFPWGALATFSLGVESDEYLYSIYVYAKYRRLGHFSSWLKSNPVLKMLSDGCDSYDKMLLLKKHPYESLKCNIHVLPEYILISDYFESYCNEFTGIHFMNAVDEVLFILKSGILLNSF